MTAVLSLCHLYGHAPHPTTSSTARYRADTAKTVHQIAHDYLQVVAWQTDIAVWPSAYCGVRATNPGTLVCGLVATRNQRHATAPAPEDLSV